MTTSTRDHGNIKTTNSPAQWEVPDQIRVIKEDLGLGAVFDFMGEDNEACRQPRPETGATIMQVEDQMGQGVYMDACQNYSFVRRKIVKPAKKWRTATDKPKEVRPSADNQRTSAASSLKTADKVQTRPSRGIFRFGSAAKEVTEPESSPTALQELPGHQDRTEDRGHTTKKPKNWSKTVKLQARTEMTQGSDHTGNSTRKRRGTAPIPRTTNQYELRGKELKTEVEGRAQRRIFYWKKRQQKKLKENTEVLDASVFLWKKVQKEIRNKRRRTNKKKQTRNKAMKTPTGTTSILEVEELGIFCLEKRQQSSSAVRFARFRSNRRYKPGD